MVNRNDVAKLANVSPTVVSYVLNNSNYVSKEKREAVLAAIEELQYIPNQTARNLKQRKTNQIAIVRGNQLNDMFNDLLFYMENIAYQKGYFLSLMTAAKDKDYFATQKFVDTLKGMRFDAVFVANSSLTEAHINQIVSSGTAVLLYVTREYLGLDKRVSCIVPDYKNGIYKLIDHLIRLGHRRIVYVNNSFYPSVWTTRNYRFDGYVKAMTEHELLVDPRYIIPQNDTIEDVIKNIDKIFDSCTGKETPTAIYSDESVVAATIINHLKERGLKIPDDVSVVSSSDSTLAKMISPRLTAVGFDAYTFAMDSMNMILDLLNKNIGSTKIVELTLSERESTSKAINR
jgi:DNA-binding LacI/PurR family transcriptional regulator